MDISKYTTGPWKVYLVSLGEYGTISILNDDFEIVARTNSLENAKLIANSLKMYKLLNELNQHDPDNKSGHWSKEIKELLESIDA